jgi:hypothetical protein
MIRDVNVCGKRRLRVSSKVVDFEAGRGAPSRSPRVRHPIDQSSHITSACTDGVDELIDILALVSNTTTS